MPPTPIAGACVWDARMADSPRWQRDWPADALAELDAALPALRGRDWHAIARTDLALPATAAFLAGIADELENGIGFVRLRGLPAARHGEDDLRRLWFALGLLLGTPVFQNRHGELMRAIRDEGAGIGRRYGEVETASGPFLSSYARTLSNGALRFHTDRCDVVGLLCVRSAAAGGTSLVCSSAAVHNAMLARHPEQAAALYGDIWRSRLGEEAGGEHAPYPLPVFGQCHGKFTSHYSLTYIEAAQLLPGVPKLSPVQRAAIDTLMALAQELSFAMEFAPGDIQLINNHVIYHGRTPFTDAADGGRLLLRLWLAMPNSRALPADHAVLWRDTAAGALRGGIGQEPVAAA